MLFWTIVASLTVVVIAALLWPLLTRRPARPAAVEGEDAPLVAVYRDRRREIERERDAGRLSPAEAEAAVDELVARMATDLPEAASAPASPEHAVPASGAARLAALVLAIAVPVASGLVYLSLGAPELADGSALRDADAMDERKLDAMIRDLEEKVRANAEDGEAWMMLAGARKFRGQPAAANEAFEQALKRVPPSARLLAEFAESLALVREGRFEGRPMALLEQALQLDANDPKAIALMGAAQYQAGNLAQARVHLRRLLDSMPADRPEREALREVLSRIDSQIGASSDAALTGAVTLDPALLRQAAAMRTLFVFARSTSGPRIPLAVLRVDNPSMPMEFRLDDSLAMDPSRKLSTAGEVIVEARLSASGSATRQPGDLYGESIAVSPGASGLLLRIDRVVQP